MQQRVLVDATGDASHLQNVAVALPTEAVAVERLVGEGEHVVSCVEVAHRVMDVDRLHRVPADEVHGVERLGQLQQVTERVAVAGAAHSVAVDVVRRAADGAVGEPPPADLEIVVGVPAVQRELRRRLGNAGDDELAREAHTAAGLVDVGADLVHDAARLGAQELHADALEDRQRRLVDGLDLVGGHDLGVVETHSRLLPWRLLRKLRTAGGSGSFTTPSTWGGGVGHGS